MIQLVVEDEVLVMPLELMSEGETGLACSGLACAGGLGEIAPSIPSDKTLRKLAKVEHQAKKQAKRAARGETPPTIPSLPDFTLPKVGTTLIDFIPPGPPQPIWSPPGPLIDWSPYDPVSWIPAPRDPVVTLPPKAIGGAMPAPSVTVTDTFWIPGPGPQDPIIPPKATGGRYLPPADRLPGTGPRRDWRKVLDAPRRGRRPEGGAETSTGTAVESPPFQAPPTVSVGSPAGPGTVAPEPAAEMPAPAEEPGVLNIGGMQIRTSTLMWAGAIVGGFILLNNMSSKKR